MQQIHFVGKSFVRQIMELTVLDLLLSKVYAVQCCQRF